MANINYNRVTLGGRITKELELKSSGSGNYYCQFSVAITTGKDKHTEFFNCTAFGKTAELVTQHFGKGSNILIDGRLAQNTYEKDGQKRSTTSVTVDNVFFIDSKNETPKQETFEELPDNSDLPF